MSIDELDLLPIHALFRFADFSHILNTVDNSINLDLSDFFIPVAPTRPFHLYDSLPVVFVVDIYDVGDMLVRHRCRGYMKGCFEKAEHNYSQMAPN